MADDDLNIREKLAHIDQMPPWIFALSGMTIGAALFAAGAAFIKLIG